MSDSRDNVEEAFTRWAKKTLRRSRKRTAYAVLLLLLGAVLLYQGFSDYNAFSITCGFLFALYGLFLRFHIRKAKVIVKEIEQELVGLRESARAKSADAGPCGELERRPD